jgi:hypothetical protein
MPGLINENPVQTDEGGGGSTIRPSVSTVPEGKLKKRKVVNGVIEEISVRRGEIGIVPVGRITGKVEVTSDEPRGVVTGIMSPQTVEEGNFSGTITGGVDIGDPKAETIVRESEVDGEGVARSDRTYDVKELRVPGGDEPAGGSKRVDVVKGPKRGGEEGASLIIRDGTEFGLLETNEVRLRGRERGAHDITLVHVTQTTNVPGTHDKNNSTTHLITREGTVAVQKILGCCWLRWLKARGNGGNRGRRKRKKEGTARHPVA